MGKLEFTINETIGTAIISPFVANDERGKLYKYYSIREFSQIGIKFNSVEEAFLESKKGVLRGIHFQETKQQPKVLNCIQGRLFVLILDVNCKRNSFGSWWTQEIKAYESIFIPGDCALGSLSLTDSVSHIMYGEEFDDKLSTGIRCNGPDGMIEWPLDKVDSVVISEKDRQLPYFSEYKNRCMRK